MRGETGFLPNFCGARAVFLLMLAAELLALALALARGEYGDFWIDLALISLFVQWTALMIAAVLCLLRRILARLAAPQAAALSFVLALAVTLTVSLAVMALGESTGWSLVSKGRAHSFLLRNNAIAAIVALIALRYFYVQHQWRLNVAAEARAREQALTARIRPHFLFNSLNTIASLAHDRPQDAEAAVLDLADLFRAALHGRERIPLSEEIDLARGYLRIEGLRLGPRLSVDWRITEDVPMDAPVPALIIQPLVENAVRHGIEPRTDGGTVGVSISRNDDWLSIAVSNPLPPAGAAVAEGNRMAQDNIRQRLMLAGGGSDCFEAGPEGGLYRVRARLRLGALA